MNQILITDSISNEIELQNHDIQDIDWSKVIYTSKVRSKSKRYHFFRMQLLFSFSVILICFVTYFTISNNGSKNDQIASKIKNNFNISTLYNDNNEVIFNNTSTENSSYSIIGIIKIEKLKIDYPIFSYSDDKLLKIAPCRFYGPYPNQIGNLCIAGHNYDNNKFFSRIKELNISDSILIYDSYGNSVEYFVYDNYEVNFDDSAPTLQETNGKKEITLVTCNNLNNKRIIIKAKEK